LNITYASIPSRHMLATLSTSICRGSMNRNMSLSTFIDRTTYRSWYCS